MKASKRGCKAGSKVSCAPWTATEDAQLTALVEAWGPSKGPKSILWADAVQQLGSVRNDRRRDLGMSHDD